VTLDVAAAALLLLDRDVSVPDNWGFRGFTILTSLPFATTGALVAWRRPANPIGWLLLVAGVANAYQGLAQEYAIRGVLAAPGSLPAPELVAWSNAWLWTLGFGPVMLFLFFVFPDGRLPSPRWRAAPFAAAAATAMAMVTFAFRPGPLENFTAIANPLPVPAEFRPAYDLISLAMGPAAGGVALVAAGSLVLRARRADAAQRQQLKWVALSGGLVALSFTFLLATGVSKAGQILVILAFGTFPVSVAIAILRYRLYDIDVLINRALVYGAVSASLAVTYFAAVLLLQAALRPFTTGSEIAVAGSTLVVVALFQPVRARVQNMVDRRFYRSRYDAARTLEAFGARLRDEVDLDEFERELVTIVDRTVRPTHASVWLRAQR
jgi:hypothetical protein